MSQVTYILKTLGASTLRSESVVQLLMFASRHKSEHDKQTTPRQEVVLIAADADVSGIGMVRECFPDLAAEDVSYLPLAAPAVEAVGYPEHQLTCAVFEALKAERQDEIHFADRGGLGHYLVTAKRCGTHFVETTLVSHVMGGTLFCLDAEERLVDTESALMLDVFECNATEFSDVVFIHDRLAWAWYEKRLASVPTQRFDLSWSAQEPSPDDLPIARADAAEPSGDPIRLVYFGVLGPESGLRGFCDAVSLFLQQRPFPVRVVLVGEPKAVGAIDAVTYIRIRSQAWNVPIAIRRNLTLPEEFELIAGGESIVVCDATRKVGLRARLLQSLGMPSVLLAEREDALPTTVPASVVARIIEVKSKLGCPRSPRNMVTVWSQGRPWSIAPVRADPLDPPLLPPRVSVIVTHFSRPQKLRFALESLKAQTYRNFEVIVVDDGSPDPGVVRELQAIEKDIKPLGWTLIRQANRYLGAARNRGAKEAHGKYVLFMDDDNYARPCEIESLVSVAERLQADIVTSFYDGFESDGAIAEDKPKFRFAPVGGDLAFSVFSPALGDANALYSLEMFRKVGGFTEDYGITHEDWEFHVRAGLAGAKRVTLPIPLFWYRIDAGGMYRNPQMALHANANLLRHIRPYLETLPHYQAKLLQIAQGLSVQQHRTQPAVLIDSGASISPQENLSFGRVAIIVRTKDRPVMLQRAMQDILAQSYQDWVVVVVNDGGDVPVLDMVLEQFQAALGGRLVRVDNPVSCGMQTASNIGIGACDSDFIVIHDDDDTWSPEFLARTVANMDQNGWNPHVAGVVTWSRVIVEEIVDGYDIVEIDRFIFNDRLHTLSLVDLGVENRFPPISFLFRRTAFEAVGRFREEFGVLGDWDFHLRVLERFNIGVISEPLAGYHHRSETTGGAYGNSVHAQKDVHAVKRIELVNSFVREAGSPASSTLGQVLLHGQIYKNLEREQQGEFQRLHNHFWEMEQRLTREIGEASKTRFGSRLSNLWAWFKLRRPSENLVENGDFRIWPGPGRLFRAGERTTGIVSPGCLIAFNGNEVTYTLERMLSDGTQVLEKNKTYLSVANKGGSGGGKYLWLEFPIGDVEAIVGQTLRVSGTARLKGVREWISAGGRIDFPNRKPILFKERRVFLMDEFRPWSCALQCPATGSVDLSGSLARIHIQLHYAEPFTFDLTDVQVKPSSGQEQ